MLGTDLVRLLNTKGCRASAWDLPDFDITRREHLEKALAGSEIVVNCAAFTNVDGAEDAPDVAMAVNADAAGALGRLAAERGIFVVHISTDFVFDGHGDTPYSESDAPHPLSVYGKSKLEGEKQLEQSGCDCAIMRVQWSYGAAGTNFIFKLLQRAKSGADLKVVNDQVGAPTWTADMARAIECLIRKRSRGLYHFANGGYASRFDTAVFILRELGLSNKIEPCASSDFPMKAERPANSRFNTGKIQALLDHDIRSWQAALAEFLGTLPRG
jgi:dTDP-4-dehydrorhamnose reductase